MKIAFTGNVLPFGEGVAYGGERMLYWLLQGLHKLGHEIYLFSTGGTNVPSEFIKDYVAVSPLTNEKDVYYEAIKKYIDKTKIDFDLYACNYFGEGWDPEVMLRFPYSEVTWCRWCHAHWQLKQKPFNVVSYSKVLQQDFMEVNIETTMIHHGIPIDTFNFQPDHDGYAVWIGKIEGGKAPHLAIKLAKAAGLKIVIMGPPYNTGTFWKEVAPYIDNETVFWVRGVDDQQKNKIMSKAKVFISSNMNTWKEHFGLVNIEALAMGVPIIGFNKINQDCAIKTDNIIIDGKHGFFLNYNDSNDVQEILDKGVPLLNKIDQIDRMECRKYFEERFTNDLMARRYEYLYKKITEGERFGELKIPF